MPKTALTGIKPTGSPHLGNYLGMIKPAFELLDRHQGLFFIADYHALTTDQAPDVLRHRIYEAAATWLALGLNPEQVVFYRQSAVPQVFELTWILACCTAKGLLNRAHAYKAAVTENIRQGRHADALVNAGLYSYPVLMAADILVMDADVVPVGRDQRQHIEVARDIAAAFNSRFGKVFSMPDALVHSETMIVPGLDGRKMSKSYRNTIPVFAEPETVRKQVMRIQTDAKSPGEAKDPEKCNIFAIYRHFAPPDAVAAKRRLYEKGGLAYSEIKEELAALLNSRFAAGRQAYERFMAKPDTMDRILAQGAARARFIATSMMTKVGRKIGIGPNPGNQ